MALTIVRPVQTTAAPKAGGKGQFNFKVWYKKNKKSLSERRKARYHTDPSYREKALNNSRGQRKNKPVEQDGGFTVAFQDAADQVDVTIWTLREWRKKNYFPEPRHRAGRMWLKPYHVEQLKTLKAFFDHHGIRVTADTREPLKDLVSLIYANW